MSSELPYASRKIKIARNYRKSEDEIYDSRHRHDIYDDRPRHDYHEHRHEEMKISIHNDYRNDADYREDDYRREEKYRKHDDYRQDGISKHSYLEENNGNERGEREYYDDEYNKAPKKSKKHKKEHKHSKDKDKDGSKHKSSKSKHEDRESDESYHKSKHKHKKKDKKKSKDKDKDRDRSTEREKDKSDKKKAKVSLDYDSGDWDSEFEEQEKLKKLERTLQNQKESSSSWYKIDESELSQIEQGLHLKGTRNTEEDVPVFKEPPLRIEDQAPASPTPPPEDHETHKDKRKPVSPPNITEPSTDTSSSSKAPTLIPSKPVELTEHKIQKPTKSVEETDVFEKSTKMTEPGKDAFENRTKPLEPLKNVFEKPTKSAEPTESVFEKEPVETNSAVPGAISLAKKTIGNGGGGTLKFGLKLSDTSRALISSGATQEDIRKQNLEDGKGKFHCAYLVSLNIYVTVV